MDIFIDSFGEACIFSAMDANSSYRQVKVSDRNRDITFFISHHSLYQLLRMPLGLDKRARYIPKGIGRYIVLYEATVGSCLPR